MSYSLVYLTAKDQKEADQIGKTLVEKHLAACANIVPKVRSYYWWNDKLCEDLEALVFLKTETRLVDKVIAEVKRLHSYQVPAISVLKIEEGDPDFLKWISGEVAGTE